MDYSLVSTITANIIAFSVGTAATWTSPVLEKLKSETSDNPLGYKITDEEGSWITACLSLGALIGPFIFGILMDKIGRKWTLITIGAPYLIGCLLMAFTKSIYFFYIARFIFGLSGGGVFNVVPVYIGEIASANKRGMLCSMMNIFFCVGELFSYCVGPYIKVTTFNMILAIFPGLFLVSFFIFAPESPYYYLKNGEDDKARSALQKFRGSKAEVEEELSIIRKSIKETEDGTLKDIFGSRELRRGLVIILGLMVFQQLSGIIAIMSFAQTIFKQADVDLDPIICAIILGALQLVIALITPFTIDTIGRRKLLLFSAVGTFLSEGTLGIFSVLRDNWNYDLSSLSIIPFVSLMLYIVTYNIGCGPLPWVIMGELFPQNVKASASLLCTSFSLTLTFLVSKYFQIIVDAVGLGGTFLIFTGSCLLSIPFCYFFTIETKGKSLQEIKEELGK